jgi:F-type H+-transporting ATPase subunit alpha
MQLNSSEISELIKSRIQGLEGSADVRNQGTVISVADGICRIHGLSDVMQGEMLEFPGNTFGLAMNLERDSVGAVILGAYEHISEGDIVKTTGRILEVPIGPELCGRVVNALGQPIDGKGPVDAKLTAPIEKIAPGVIARESVSQPLQTGIKSIDAMVPIGRGQRELIIGDRQTGKSAVAVDAIINQKVRTSPACTWRSARRPRPSRTSCARWKSTARWRTPSWSPLPLRNRQRCSTSRPTRAARWANTSATAAKTR